MMRSSLHGAGAPAGVRIGEEDPTREESWATSAAVRRSMQGNRSRNTVPEMRFRAALHQLGLRFFKHRRPVPELRCEADVVFPRIRLAVFLDGCFWHGCPQHGSRPAVHDDYWRAKLQRNRTRDVRNNEALRAAGWTVLRLWEHEPVECAVQKVADLVADLRASQGRPAPCSLCVLWTTVTDCRVLPTRAR